MRLEQSLRDGLYFSMWHLQAYRSKDTVYKGFFLLLNKAINFVHPGLNWET